MRLFSTAEPKTLQSPHATHQKAISAFFSVFAYAKRDFPNEVPEDEIEPLLQEIGWRLQSAGMVSAITAASTDSWFQVRLNDRLLWLPRYTLMTMRHCFTGSGEGLPTVLVETPHWEILRKAVESADIFLDVGAATGAMAVPFAMEFPQVRVVAFEPSPRARHYLSATAERNSATVTVLPFAISDQAGSLDFMEQPEDITGETPFLPETSRLALPGERFAYQDAQRHSVEVRTLDSLQDEIGISGSPKIIIKIDVEGFECHVLRGAAELIRKHRPFLSIDIHQIPGEETLTDDGVMELLSPFKYTVQRMGHVLLALPE